jgi:DNA polymerase-3 subunit delta'
MTNWHIIGHEWAVDYLRRSVAAGRDAHSYLFIGPAGVGKSLLALRLAQALNCDTPHTAPCLQCRACRRIEHGNYPDVRITGMAAQAAGLKPEEAARQKELKIDTVREWQRDINLRPYEGRRRVFILHDAEYLNEESSNALLKTLEEPPPFATLVLVANRDNMLATITSRCQILRLRPLPRQQVARALTTLWQIPQDQATLIAAWSDGLIGWALRLAHTPEEIEQRQNRLSALLEIQNQPRHLAFRWAEERSQEYRSGQQALVLEWLELWQSWWRDVLLMSVGCPESITHMDRRADLEREAQRYELPEISRFIQRLGETTQQLRENVNPQLALEHTVLHLPDQ